MLPKEPQSIKSIDIDRQAAECCFWPLFEYEDGEYTLNYRPKTKQPVDDWMKLQGRFRHLYKDTETGKEIIRKVQEHVDHKWEKLLRLCGEA